MPRADQNAEPLIGAVTAPAVAGSSSRSNRARLIIAASAIGLVGALAIAAKVFVDHRDSSGTSGIPHSPSSGRDAGTISHTNLTERFAAWKEVYRPTERFTSAGEFDAKLEIFGENLRIVDHHNERYAAGDETL
jgi:hypothetical protein